VSDEKTVLRPGFASEEPEPEEPAIDMTRAEAAHYGGLTESQAAETWARETLCRTCLCQGVCRVAAAAEGPLVTVSRCLSYLPGSG